MWMSEWMSRRREEKRSMFRKNVIVRPYLFLSILLTHLVQPENPHHLAGAEEMDSFGENRGHVKEVPVSVWNAYAEKILKKSWRDRDMTLSIWSEFCTLVDCGAVAGKKNRKIHTLSSGGKWFSRKSWENEVRSYDINAHLPIMCKWWVRVKLLC